MWKPWVSGCNIRVKCGYPSWSLPKICFVLKNIADLLFKLRATYSESKSPDNVGVKSEPVHLKYTFSNRKSYDINTTLNTMAEYYTFKKLSNDPLSKNSLRIIIGLPMKLKKKNQLHQVTYESLQPRDESLQARQTPPNTYFVWQLLSAQSHLDD